MRTIVIQTQIPSGSTRRHETWHEMDTRLIYNFKSLKMSKKINKSNSRKLLFTCRHPRHLWCICGVKGRSCSETNLHCVRRSFISFLGGGAERGIRSGKRVLHDLALTLLFHDSAFRTFLSLSQSRFLSVS